MILTQIYFRQSVMYVRDRNNFFERNNTMAVCDGPWRMTLVSDAGSSEVFVFKNIALMGTTFTGEVWDSGVTRRISALTGTCEDLAIGDPRLTRITFQFRLPGRTGAVGMFLAGVGFVPAMANAEFRGRFRAYTPDGGTPPFFDKGDALAIVPDVGDTGTGTGMQAM